jgi:hypothetical protein
VATTRGKVKAEPKTLVFSVCGLNDLHLTDPEAEIVESYNRESGDENFLQYIPIEEWSELLFMEFCDACVPRYFISTDEVIFNEDGTNSTERLEFVHPEIYVDEDTLEIVISTANGMFFDGFLSAAFDHDT